MQDKAFEGANFAAWGSETKPSVPKPQMPASTTENRGYSPSWVPNWGNVTVDTTNITGSSGSNSASKAPINPFTGKIFTFFDHLKTEEKNGTHSKISH